MLLFIRYIYQLLTLIFKKIRIKLLMANEQAKVIILLYKNIIVIIEEY